MSNFLAVATATRALQHFLADAITETQVGAVVETRKPPAEPPADPPVVTVFLYQVTPNAALRNLDTVTRAPDGTVLKKPQAAIDLHYLISFYGNETDLIPQRLMGSVVAALHEQPILTKRDIEAAAGAAPLLGSDLAASPQLIRFTPAQMDLDDMSKLWSTMIQTPFALSVVYQATAVLLDGRATPAAGKPVLRRQIAVEPFRRPVIESVRSLPAGSTGVPDDDPVTRDRELALAGSSLARPGLSALVGGEPAPVVRASDDLVVLAQPGTLPSGVHPVQLRYDVEFGEDKRPWLESNAMPYVRRPRVTKASVGPVGEVRVRVDIPVTPEQRVMLLLDEKAATGKPRSYQFPAKFPLGTSPVAEFGVAIEDVDPGTYLVRVQVDGAQSPLDVADGTFSGPVVTV